MEEKDVKKLARLRTKRRMDGWGEQLRSPFLWLLIVLLVVVFQALIITIPPALDNPWPLIVTVVIGGFLSWIFLRLHNKRWVRKRYAELYEEELLNIKLHQHK